MYHNNMDIWWHHDKETIGLASILGSLYTIRLMIYLSGHFKVIV